MKNSGSKLVLTLAYDYACRSVYLLLWNTALLVPAVIIELTKKRDGREFGEGKGFGGGGGGVGRVRDGGFKSFIYRRPTLYPLEIAVDFLKSL
jgi:hypothetical protein